MAACDHREAQLRRFATDTDKWCRAGYEELEIIKNPEKKSPGFNMKDWRLPTLAEAIQPLPSAMQRLTAVFGMGTGRTTAVLPPKMEVRSQRSKVGNFCSSNLHRFPTKFLKIVSEAIRRFFENYTQESIGFHNSRVEIAFFRRRKRSSLTTD